MLSLSLFSLVVLVILNLIGTNVLATQGFAVNELEMQTLKLEKENRALKVKIEERVNLREISQLAQNQGFSKASDIVFMPTPPTTAWR